MMLRKSLAVILALGLALAGAPLMAQDFAPNTIWGESPSSVSATSAFAILQDTAGNLVGTVPVTAGRFSFENIPPGEYTVALQDAARFELIRSLIAQMSSGGVVRAIFDRDRAAAYVPTSASSGGIGTTGWILIGAGAVGITTAVILLTNNDEGNASPSQ